MTSKRGKKYCSVFGCLNNDFANPDLSFFIIPTQPEMHNLRVRPACNWLGTFVFNSSKVTFSIKLRKFTPDRCCSNLRRGIDYIRNPKLNKGLAFTLEERQILGLQGLLAANFKTQEEQVAICAYSVDRFKNNLNKHLYLAELLDTNEKLFFDLLSTNVEKYLPLVYTPVVGLACQRFGLVYKRPRGIFLSIHDKGRIETVLRNWPEPNVRCICVTDGERILGLGDLGAYGMGIPIGKLCLLTALAGIPPAYTLPITLDVGTNTELLLEDPLYIGLREKRVRGQQYDEFIQEFLDTCVRRYSSRILIMFEDFAIENSVRLLDMHKGKFNTFNDDIQGTAGVIVAGMIAAIGVVKRKLHEHIYLFLGAGGCVNGETLGRYYVVYYANLEDEAEYNAKVGIAAVGIANLLVDAMKEINIQPEEARKKIYLFDIDGLLSTKRQGGVPAHAVQYGKDLEPTKDFEGFVRKIKPTCLVGVSTKGGTFTPAILQEMAKHCDRPLIFALSNPTIKAECTPAEAYEHTQGRCIYASGSPFPPTTYGGKKYFTGQGNNSYVFPGAALGAIACQTRHVTDSMFLAAAKCLAGLVTQTDLDVGRIYPPLTDIRNISSKIGAAVIEEAYKLNLAGVAPKPKDLLSFVNEFAYDTKYNCYIPDLYDYPKPPAGIKVKSIKDMIEA